MTGREPTMDGRKSILITGACGVTSRAVARSLRMSERFGGARLVGTDIADNIYGLYEGLYDKVYRVPLTAAAGYLPLIRRICTEEAIDLSIVTPEPEVLFWAEREMPVPSLLPPPRFSRIAISKKRTHEVLARQGLVAEFRVVSRAEILGGEIAHPAGKSSWLRDFAEGSTSGKGALRATSAAEMQAWAILNPSMQQFMIADYLPGRNLACCLLFYRGTLLKMASYERVEYFMGRTVMSGISGNISRGRLINDELPGDTAEKAVRLVAAETREEMHGLVTVDLKEDESGTPLVTEINLRHVAATSAFAQAGANMAEAQVLATLGDIRTVSIGEPKFEFPPNNLILRDIDGLPIWLSDHREVEIGRSV